MNPKILTPIILILSLNFYGQNLIGTRWLKVDAERKDGSVIHDRLNTKNSYTEYYFKSLNKMTVNSVKPDADYKITNSELTIGKQKYTIEKLNATELIICEQGDLNTTDDKINRLFFIEEKSIIDYLKQKNWFSFVNDSTIIAKNFLHPKLKNNKDLSWVITKSLKNQYFVKSNNKELRTGFLTGNFHINTLGKIDKVEITRNSNIYDNVVEKFIKALEKIDFTPIEIDKKYNQIVNFSAIFTQFSIMSEIYIETNTNGEEPINRGQGLSIKKRKESQQFFNDGIIEFNKTNYSGAIKKYNEVIEIDSLFFDAYYNRAYTNLILKNVEDACKDWEYLKTMGQKEGSYLYDQKCKKETTPNNVQD